ncbi:MAG: hypothetical protein H6791_02645 [Candidatus Nomurabacteria bacterium]|nr:MAG: hypothetical protein H6791_02645 [Candidatus Nomurabacteria bacterium]
MLTQNSRNRWLQKEVFGEKSKIKEEEAEKLKKRIWYEPTRGESYLEAMAEFCLQYEMR